MILWWKIPWISAIRVILSMSCRSSPFSLDPHNPFLCLTLIFEFTYNYIDKCNLLCSLSIQENPKYAKYRNFNCSEIYDTHEKLFDDTGDSMKYAFSPSKLSQRGFDLGTIVKERTEATSCQSTRRQPIPVVALFEISRSMLTWW